MKNVSTINIKNCCGLVVMKTGTYFPEQFSNLLLRMLRLSDLLKGDGYSPRVV